MYFRIERDFATWTEKKKRVQAGKGKRPERKSAIRKNKNEKRVKRNQIRKTEVILLMYLHLVKFVRVVVPAENGYILVYIMY